MKKRLLLLTLWIFVVLGCSSNDGDSGPLSISVTQFETSYNEVVLTWEVNRPSYDIIQDLQIFRLAKSHDSDFIQPEMIANLPSNTTTFTDVDVPYYSNVTYTIKVNYKDSRTDDVENITIFSEPQIFSRDLVKFETVPFQVKQDPLQNDVFHVFEKSGTGFLKRYNSSQNEITTTKVFEQRWVLTNRFQIFNATDLYIADYYGKVYKINTSNYQTTTFATAITDKLNAFAIEGDIFYYQDDEILKYHNMTTNISTSTYYGMGFQSIENIAPGTFLFLYNSSGYSSGASIYQTTSDCPTGPSCSYVPVLWSTMSQMTPSAIDPTLFTWNSQKTKFISSTDGRVVNINSLQQEVILKDITGKRYIQYAFDAENNMYAAVQGEKIIHKFNANYELIEVIATKLYPIFPMLTNNGLQVIGAYEPISYWNYDYGRGFDFNVECAVETF